MGRRGEEGGSCDDDHHLLSEDLLIQILLLLPAISLLRFKSVCKSWLSIIESPFFIHLHGGSISRNSNSLLFQRSVQDKDEKGNLIFFTLSGDEFEIYEDLGNPGSLSYYLEMEEFEVLKGWFEVTEASVSFFVVGCLDGIICLHDFLTRNIVLWNPCTKQTRILPKPSNLLGFSKCFNKGFISDYQSDDFVRFGIDIKTNDYKLLLITTLRYVANDYKSSSEEFENVPHERRVYVYSLSTDSWKCIDDATLSADHSDLDIHIDKFENQGVYLHGSYFFTATYYNEDIKEYLLLSFDFTGEIFKTIQPPFDLRNNYFSGFVSFIFFGEKVALVHAKEEGVYDIWVLNEENGVKDPWTKFYTIGPPGIFNPPIFITNNGEFAIRYACYWQDGRQQDAPKLQLFNLITGENKVLQWDCNYNMVYVYKPSLMPVGGNGAKHKYIIGDIWVHHKPLL